ncbi:uncharacterized protein LOC130818545 [Amaranthus tricolor]|uniref:uncharacterized protein LOC130818545 n=1 Tax=Amaranthus tricolor TaxID=29722 RepID=UPI00258E2A6D|nr:uncharacterized protein LOC130818545 [Amaranthus tricolor]
MAETFNNYIMHARSKHLIDMLDDIRTMLMKRIATKREECASKWSGLLCPKVQVLLDKEKEEVSNCTVLLSTATVFQVAHHIDVLEVDIERRTCTCMKWDLKWIPCCHVVASISYLHKDVELFVDECNTKDAYTRAYTGSIAPYFGERHWPKIDMSIDPPPSKLV